MASLRIDNGIVVTVDSRRRIIKDGSVAVEGSAIVAVGKTSAVKKSYPAEKVIDARQGVVMPGFVDCHAHVSAEPIIKGVIPDDAGHIRSVREWASTVHDVIEPDDEYVASLLSFVEMIRSGTTAFVEGGTVKYMDSVVRAISEAGIRGAIGQYTADSHSMSTLASGTEQAIQLTEKNVRTYNGLAGGRVMAWCTTVGHHMCSDELLLGLKDIAEKHDTGITLHMSSWPEDVDYYLTQTGERPMIHLSKIGFLGKNVVIAHAVNLDDSEVRALRERSARVAFCPSTALRLGYGITQVGKFPEMIKAGVCVALGCDSLTASNYFDMGRLMYMAAGLFKDARRDLSMVPAEKAVEMATIDGAKAMQLEDEIGSLEVGKKADVIVFNSGAPEWNPLFNVVNSLVYSADGKSVATSVIDGRVVMEEGKLTNLDEKSIFAAAQKAGQSLIDRGRLKVPSRWPVE